MLTAQYNLSMLLPFLRFYLLSTYADRARTRQHQQRITKLQHNAPCQKRATRDCPGATAHSSAYADHAGTRQHHQCITKSQHNAFCQKRAPDKAAPARMHIAREQKIHVCIKSNHTQLANQHPAHISAQRTSAPALQACSNA